MDANSFQELLVDALYKNMAIVQTEDKKDWTVKGFIDVFKNIYTISVDTKVISKILELMLFPTIAAFAAENDLKIVHAKHQNHYPDISFISPDGKIFALDIKSTYRTNKSKVNGFTLGAFTGYFRNRESNKNITFPYNRYDKHFVLGIIYSKQEGYNNEEKIYGIEDLENILSVVSNFEFVVQEKYRIASSRPGSGNTKNIGSIVDKDKLVSGEGPFAKLGIDIFDDYWMYYMTKDMAEDIQPYTNLKTYIEYKKVAPNIDSEDITEEDGLEMIEEDDVE